MADTAVSDVTEGPVLSLINKRLRALRKKLNRITQMEESISQGKVLNKEQEEVFRSKPSVIAAIDELDKLRQPLSAAVSEEINIAIQCHQVSAENKTLTLESVEPEEEQKAFEGNNQLERDQGEAVIEDLLNLLYFGSMFDVKTQSDLASSILTRTHERECCLSYDYVSDDDATDPLVERDLDLISMVGSLLTSRSVNSSLPHKTAVQKCIEHAKLWLANSDQPIDPDFDITYAGLREKLAKIMASNYFTTSPQLKAPGEMAAAAGNYGSFQVSENLPVAQVEELDVQYQQKEEATENFQGNESYDNQSSPVEEEYNKVEISEVPTQTVLVEQEDVELNEQQYIPRKPYQNQRGGRGGGGRRGYVNVRLGRGGSRGGGAYQNGRGQYFNQPENYYYPRNTYNIRGRGGGRGAGGNLYNNRGTAVQGES